MWGLCVYVCEVCVYVRCVCAVLACDVCVCICEVCEVCVCEVLCFCVWGMCVYAFVEGGGHLLRGRFPLPLWSSGLPANTLSISPAFFLCFQFKQTNKQKPCISCSVVQFLMCSICSLSIPIPAFFIYRLAGCSQLSRLCGKMSYLQTAWKFNAAQ